MAVYNIPIHGLIGSPEEKGDSNKYFQYTDLLLHLNNAKHYDTLNLDIASDGGYCDAADKMIEAIKNTGKFLTTCNSGNVCSAATKLFTLPHNKAVQTFYPERGCFLIHNPWVEAVGDSASLIEASKELKSIENEYAKWYSQATGSDINILQQFMAENKPLTPDQVESLGFATIAHVQVKAFAKLKSNTQMDNKELEKVSKQMSGIEKFFKALFLKLQIKSLMLADVNGAELEFPEINDPSELVVGIQVLQNGAPGNGEFVMADGTVVKAENGIVTEVVPVAAPPVDQNAEIEALKAEIESLKAGKAQVETEATAAKEGIVQAKAELMKLKSQFTDFKFKAAKPEEDKNKNIESRKPFKTKE